MVVILEVGFLVLCSVLGLWWLTRTNQYRAQRRSGVWSGQYTNNRTFGMYEKPVPPQHPGSEE